MRINIVGGRGQMGQVHKPILEAKGHEVVISGRRSYPDIEESTSASDLTIISVPISAFEESVRRIAPYADAMMDFTSIKMEPLECMLMNARDGCEVGGLHPLYKSNPIGKTMVYCPTSKSGELCLEVVESFRNSGIKIKTMKADEHDLYVGAVAQSSRTLLFEAFAILAEKTGLSVRELYEISPPPTKLLLDLISRQVGEDNGEMYQEMRQHNPFYREISCKALESLREVIASDDCVPGRIRNYFGDELLKAQERAEKLIRGE